MYSFNKSLQVGSYFNRENRLCFLKRKLFSTRFYSLATTVSNTNSIKSSPTFFRHLLLRSLISNGFYEGVTKSQGPKLYGFFFDKSSIIKFCANSCSKFLVPATSSGFCVRSLGSLSYKHFVKLLSPGVDAGNFYFKLNNIRNFFSLFFVFFKSFLFLSKFSVSTNVASVSKSLSTILTFFRLRFFFFQKHSFLSLYILLTKYSFTFDLPTTYINKRLEFLLVSRRSNFYTFAYKFLMSHVSYNHLELVPFLPFTYGDLIADRSFFNYFYQICLRNISGGRFTSSKLFGVYLVNSRFFFSFNKNINSLITNFDSFFTFLIGFYQSRRVNNPLSIYLNSLPSWMHVSKQLVIDPMVVTNFFEKDTIDYSLYDDYSGFNTARAAEVMKRKSLLVKGLEIAPNSSLPLHLYGFLANSSHHDSLSQSSYFYKYLFKFLNTIMRRGLRGKSVFLLVNFFFRLLRDNDCSKNKVLFFSDSLLRVMPMIRLVSHKSVSSPNLLPSGRRIPRALSSFVSGVKSRTGASFLDKAFYEFVDLLNFKGKTYKVFNIVYKSSVSNLQFSQGLSRSFMFSYNARVKPSWVRTVRNRMRLSSDLNFF